MSSHRDPHALVHHRSGASSPVEGVFSEEEVEEDEPQHGGHHGDDGGGSSDAEQGEEEEEEEEEADDAHREAQRRWFQHRAAVVEAEVSDASEESDEDDAHLVAAAALRQRWYAPSQSQQQPQPQGQPQHARDGPAAAVAAAAAAAHAHHFQSRVPAAAPSSVSAGPVAHAHRYDFPLLHPSPMAMDMRMAGLGQAPAVAAAASGPSPLHPSAMAMQMQMGGLRQAPVAASSAPPPQHARVGGVHRSGNGGAVALDDLLRCFICYGRVRHAHMCPHCSQVGCLHCYSAWLGQGKAECPFCRRALTADRLVNCRFMGDLTAALAEMGVMREDGSCASPNRGGGASAAAAAAAAGFAATGHAPCPAHPAQPMRYYCRTCSAPLCSDCALFDSAGGGGHRGHDLAPLDDIYAEHAGRVSRERSRVAERLQALRARADGVQRNATLLTRRKEERSSELRARAVQLESLLAGELRRKLAVLQSQRREISSESDLLTSLLGELDAQLDPAALPKHELIEKSAQIVDMLRDLRRRPLGHEQPDGLAPGAGAGRAPVAGVSVHPGSDVAAASIEGGAAVAASVAAAVVGAEPPGAPGAAGAGAVVGPDADASGAPLRFSDELVPQWRASDLVRVGSFAAKRRAAQQEEEQLRAVKQRLAEQRAQRTAAAAASNADLGGGVESDDDAPASLPAPAHEVWYSTPLWAHGQCWRLKLYANGNGQAKPHYISVFVELTHSHLHQPMQVQGEDSEGGDSGSEGEIEGKDDEGAQAHAQNHDRARSHAPTHVTDGPFSLPDEGGSVRPFSALSPSARSSRPSAPALSYSNRYEYRVELLPHPHHYPELAPYLNVALLQSAGGESGGAGGVVADHPLRVMTVSEYLDTLLFTHAHDAALCASLQSYASRVVSRVFESSFEHGEAWGYNRFFRLEQLGAEGYLGPAAAGAEAAAGSAAPGADRDDELLFRFYIRPPTVYLQSLEQDAWIQQLEAHTRSQTKRMRRLQRRARRLAERGAPRADKTVGWTPGGPIAESMSSPVASSSAFVSASASAAPSKPAAALPLSPGSRPVGSVASASPGAPSASFSPLAAPLSRAERTHAASTLPISHLPTQQMRAPLSQSQQSAPALGSASSALSAMPSQRVRGTPSSPAPGSSATTAVTSALPSTSAPSASPAPLIAAGQRLSASPSPSLLLSASRASPSTTPHLRPSPAGTPLLRLDGAATVPRSSSPASAAAAASDSDSARSIGRRQLSFDADSDADADEMPLDQSGASDAALVGAAPRMAHVDDSAPASDSEFAAVGEAENAAAAGASAVSAAAAAALDSIHSSRCSSVGVGAYDEHAADAGERAVEARARAGAAAADAAVRAALALVPPTASAMPSP